MKFNINVPCIFLAMAAVAFTGCGQKKEASEATAATATPVAIADSSATLSTSPQFDVDAAFQKQLGEFFTTYSALKEAFVTSDPAKVKVEADKAKASLAKVDATLVTGAAHNDWLYYEGNLSSSIKEIQGAPDIAAQRTGFSKLSNDLYKSIKAFGMGGQKAFYEYCPMAFNNEGAYWLSTDEKIRNPYFGNEMLTCGEVKERL
jgi:Cu(I)/Ag(I) efflux system membrane fusion protein